MNANPTRCRATSEPAPGIPDFVNDSVLLLGLIYLEFGIPAEAAFESAVADYECELTEIDPCRP